MMARLRFGGLWGIVLAALLLACPARAERDAWLADPVQGEWIRKADVLYIGDSESLGYFGDNLYRWLSDKSDPKTGRKLSVWTYWTCGSDVYTWLSGGRTVCGIRACNGAGRCARDHGPHDGPARVRYGPLRNYLADVSPRLTILSLGTNFLTTREFRYRGSYDFYLQRADKLAGQVTGAGSLCIWIGPPQMAEKLRSIAEYESFVGDLRKTVEAEGCRFINSSPLSDRSHVLKRDPEGTHYTGEGEKLWSAAVWKLLEPAVDKALAK